MGQVAQRRPVRWDAWVPVLALPTAVIAGTPADWPRWLFMWLLAFAVYASLKWFTWRLTPAPHAPAWRHVAYLLAWPGMDAGAFLDPGRAVQRPETREWLAAAAKLLAGVLLIWVVVGQIPTEDDLARGWVGMAGLVLVLHFGAFHLLSCAWRSAGVDARPLMDAPTRSRSVAECWGRRWNTAFRDVTHRFLFRPLTDRLGPGGALFLGFAASGLVHDLVISVPASGGFGGPTLYFLIQAAGLFIERTRIGRRLGLGRGLRGRLFTALVLVLPAPLLFHSPFVRRVILPFLGVLGAGG